MDEISLFPCNIDPNEATTPTSTIIHRSLCIISLETFGKLKVLSLLEAFFDLISGSSLSMKIQIMGRKITENPGAGRSKNFSTFFFSFSNSP